MADRASYAAENVSPILSQMVPDVLKAMPSNMEAFMSGWLEARIDQQHVVPPDSDEELVVAKGGGKGKKGKAPPPPPGGFKKCSPDKWIVKLDLKEGQACGLGAVGQQTENLRAALDEKALDADNVDMSGIDPSAKATMMKCPRCELQIREDMMESHRSSHSGEILPWLFLGGARNADNGKELTVRTGITHILNLAHEVSHDRDARKEILRYNKKKAVPFVYKKMAWYDNDSQDILPFIDEALGFIRGARSERADARVLVHCVQGISRSASVVIAYLMMFEQKSLREAHAHTCSVRPIAEPRASFLDQLGNLEKRLFGISEPTLTSAEAFEGKTMLNVDLALKKDPDAKDKKEGYSWKALNKT